jgi:hypothetical protein
MGDNTVAEAVVRETLARTCEELPVHRDPLGDDPETVFRLVHAAKILSRVESRGPARFATVDPAAVR